MDPFELKKRYPVSAKDVEISWKHQVRWQVYLPLTIGLLLLILLVGLIIATETGDTSVWADHAVVILFSLALLFGILGLAVIATAVVGVVYLIRVSPPPFDRTREAAFDANVAVSHASEAAVKPIIAPKAATYAVITGIRYLAGIFKS